MKDPRTATATTAALRAENRNFTALDAIARWGGQEALLAGTGRRRYQGTQTRANETDVTYDTNPVRTGVVASRPVRAAARGRARPERLVAAALAVAAVLLGAGGARADQGTTTR